MSNQPLTQVINPEKAQRGEVIRYRLDNSRIESASFSRQVIRSCVVLSQQIDFSTCEFLKPVKLSQEMCEGEGQQNSEK